MKRIMIFLAAILAAGCANKPKDVLWLANGPVEPQGEPYYEYRILDHWDNLDDSVERGYAGKSIWEWTSPEIPVERIHTYGRLNKSLGINGSVLWRWESSLPQIPWIRQWPSGGRTRQTRFTPSYLTLEASW